jgi:hypothetical protein
MTETEQILKHIDLYIEKLAASMGVATDYIFPLLVRQQYIDAILWLCIFIITTVPCILTWAYAIKHWHPQKGDSLYKGYDIYLENHEGLWAGILFTTTAITVIAGAMCISETPDIFNPEYHAMSELLYKIKN